MALVALLALACAADRRARFEDQLGQPVDVHNPQRIVALAPDVVELAFALGSGDRVVAVAPATDHPAAAAVLPHVNVRDVESVISFAPDLVLATTAGTDPRVVDRLRELGRAVFVTDVTSCQRLADAARLLAPVLASSARGDDLGELIERRCAAAAARAAMLPEQKALYVVWFDPIIVAGPGTFHDDMLRLARLTNLSPGGGGRYPVVSPELLLSGDLEAIVAPDEPDVRAGFQRLLRRPAGARLARGDVIIHWLPADLANRPGPRLPDAIELLVVRRLDER